MLGATLLAGAPVVHGAMECEAKHSAHVIIRMKHSVCTTTVESHNCKRYITASTCTTHFLPRTSCEGISILTEDALALALALGLAGAAAGACGAAAAAVGCCATGRAAAIAGRGMGLAWGGMAWTYRSGMGTYMPRACACCTGMCAGTGTCTGCPCGPRAKAT